MTLRNVFFPLLRLLLGTALAQESAPIPLTGKDAAPICRGRASDAPECVTPPHQIYAPIVEYTDKARKEHTQGTVVIRMVVGTDGLPRDVKVEQSLSPDLDKSATNTVKRWKFTPAMKAGEPVAVQMAVEVSFHLAK